MDRALILPLRLHTNYYKLLHFKCCVPNCAMRGIQRSSITTTTTTTRLLSSSFLKSSNLFVQSLSNQFYHNGPFPRHPSHGKEFILCESKSLPTIYQTQARTSTKLHPAEHEEQMTEHKADNLKKKTEEESSSINLDANVKLIQTSASDLKPFSNQTETNLNFYQVPPSDLLRLDGVDWRLHERSDLKELINNWLKLSKFRLTSLVVLTTLAGYYMGFSHFDPTLVTCALVGTALTSSSAAALNQFLEVPYDSQMIRTKNRPIVMKQVSPLHAFTFSLVTGVTGISLLAATVNPLTAALGALNLVLYSFVYTPMKRVNILNTWVGSVVGAIPPIMGYTAATGCIDLAAINLGLILYSWQFPHFNALSWNIKNDYARAGYRMMVVTHPDLCVRTAFRHSVLLMLYCELMCSSYVGLTTWTYGFDTLPINLYLIYLTYKFKKNPNSSTSRTLFKYSLVHLPFLIVLMLMSKKTKKEEDKETLEIVN